MNQSSVSQENRVRVPKIKKHSKAINTHTQFLKRKKMQSCEKTETNLQVMNKGNQIKNFSKKRLKTPKNLMEIDEMKNLLKET